MVDYRNQTHMNVLDFGCRPNRYEGFRTSIQNAINSVAAVPVVVLSRIPSGIYLLSNDFINPQG